jgi:hypothetical protein
MMGGDMKNLFKARSTEQDKVFGFLKMFKETQTLSQNKVPSEAVAVELEAVSTMYEKSKSVNNKREGREKFKKKKNQEWPLRHLDMDKTYKSSMSC